MLQHMFFVSEFPTVYYCTYCPKMFITRCDWDRHLKVHTGERPFKCSVCEKAFKRKDHLTSHVAHMHQSSLRRAKYR